MPERRRTCGVRKEPQDMITSRVQEYVRPSASSTPVAVGLPFLVVIRTRCTRVDDKTVVPVRGYAAEA